MRVNNETGLLDGARQVPSPNCDDRPPGASPELVVIHGISLPPGRFEGDGIDRLFTNTLDPAAHPYFRTLAGLRVSAHLLVRRAGELTQYVPFHQRAWHAGESCYLGRPRCNDYSIGIELEGSDTRPYTDAQYERLAEVLTSLFAAYPGLTSRRVAGHSDIAPERKSDPGAAFDWQRLRRMLSG